MSLVFCDSFDHYSSSNFNQKWTTSARMTIDSRGRNGNGAFIPAAGGFTKTLEPKNAWFVGFAWKNFAGDTFGGTIYSNGAVFVEPGFTGNANMLSLILNGDGTLQFTVSSGIIIATTTRSLQLDTWYYFEVKIQLGGNPVNTTAEFRVNGEVWMSGTGNTNYNTANLLFGGMTASNGHGWGSSGNGGVIIDDLYINDGNGTKNNDYMGDVKIGCIYPRQDGTIQWSGTGAGNQFLLVNEHVPDDDVSYIYTDTLAQTDDFYFDMVSSFTGVITGVQFDVYARKDDEGYRAIQALAASTGIGNTIYLNDSYVYYTFPLDDSFGTDWTPNIINVTKFGVFLFS